MTNDNCMRVFFEWDMEVPKTFQDVKNLYEKVKSLAGHSNQDSETEFLEVAKRLEDICISYLEREKLWNDSYSLLDEISAFLNETFREIDNDIWKRLIRKINEIQKINGDDISWVVYNILRGPILEHNQGEELYNLFRIFETLKLATTSDLWNRRIAEYVSNLLNWLEWQDYIDIELYVTIFEKYQALYWNKNFWTYHGGQKQKILGMHELKERTKSKAQAEYEKRNTEFIRIKGIFDEQWSFDEETTNEAYVWSYKIWMIASTYSNGYLIQKTRIRITSQKELNTYYENYVKPIEDLYDKLWSFSF